MTAVKTYRTVQMPTRIIEELSQNGALQLSQLQKIALMDGVLIEDISLTAGVDAYIPHRLGRRYAGFFVVRGHRSQSATATATASTVYGTIYRWPGDSVDMFTNTVATSGTPSLALGTMVDDCGDPCIDVTVPATAAGAQHQWIWTINDVTVPSRFYMSAVVDSKGVSGPWDVGIVFCYLDSTHWIISGKTGAVNSIATTRWNGTTGRETRAATNTTQTQVGGAGGDTAFVINTIETKLPTASTDPGLRGFFNGPHGKPETSSAYINATDYSASWESGWRQDVTGWQIGIGVMKRFTGASSQQTFQITNLYAGAHPGSYDTTTSTAVVTSSSASGFTEDLTSTDFDRAKFIKITPAVTQTVSLWVF